MRILVLAGLVAAVTLPDAQAPVRGLTAVPALARAYEAILDARFEDVPELLNEACGPAPDEACKVLEAVSAWWRIQLDPYNTTRDSAYQLKVEAAIAAATAWTKRESTRAEAWFYLGAARGSRVQWWALRGQRLAAAREGKRSKDALDRALMLDPTLTDAFLGLGVYHYYADVAPRMLRMIRWLLLLPGGDRTLGLEELHRARIDGELVRSEAEYQLYQIYVWYEKQPERALEMLESLRAKHPFNPHFPQAIAEVQDFYIDDTEASLREWNALFSAAQRGEVAEPSLAKAAARLGIASQLDQMSDGDAALQHLHVLIESRPPAPFGIVARAQFQLGQTYEHLGRRAEAAAAYRAAIAEAGRNDPLGITSRARAALRELERSPILDTAK